MRAIRSRNVRIAGLLAAICCAGPAQAGWTYQAVDFPGTPFNQVFGINDKGQVVGEGSGPGTHYAFVYSSTRSTYTEIVPPVGYVVTPFGINSRGKIVGKGIAVDPVSGKPVSDFLGFVRGSDGVFSFFHFTPGCAAYAQIGVYCDPPDARGINSEGLVVGNYTKADLSADVGFTYDPRNQTFNEFVPSCQTIANAINSQRAIVGSAYFSNAFGCPSPDGKLDGEWAWFRSEHGTVTFFRVNGLDTAARGINERGQIVGYVWSPDGATAKGFVTSVSALSSGSVAIADADLLAYPGSQWTFPEGISDEGVVSGQVQRIVDGSNINFAGGFIARRSEH